MHRSTDPTQNATAMLTTENAARYHADCKRSTLRLRPNCSNIRHGRHTFETNREKFRRPSRGRIGASRGYFAKKTPRMLKSVTVVTLMVTATSAGQISSVRTDIVANAAAAESTSTTSQLLSR